MLALCCRLISFLFPFLDPKLILACYISAFSVICSSFLISHYTSMLMFAAEIASSSQVSLAIPEVVIVLSQRNKGLTFSPLNPLWPETFCGFLT